MSERILVTGGHLICPASGLDGPGTVEIVGTEIVGIHTGDVEPGPGATRVDARGCVVTPGFIDLHARLGEPGEEYKEDLRTAGLAAARGGFTSVCASPASTPANDGRVVTEYLVRRAREVSAVRILPIGALTMGREGRRLTEMFDLCEGGAVAFGDGGRPIADASLLRRAMEYAQAVGCPVMVYPEDPSLAGEGVMHEGPVSTRLGLAGIPAAAEEAAAWRAVSLVRQTGARLHLGPVSTAGAIGAVRAAKADGLPITASAVVANLHLDHEAVMSFDTDLKVRPPLRPKSDVAALKAALAEGVLDAVGSGHQPQSAVEKALEWDLAVPGQMGLELALGLVLRLVEAGDLTLRRAVECLAVGPAKVLGRATPALAVGAPADLVVFDPQAKVRVAAEDLASRSRNTPFLGQALPGRVAWTLVEGRIAYAAERGETWP
jgi:dihydroorotase